MTFFKVNATNAVNILLVLLAFAVPLFGRSPNINKYLLILLVIAWFMRGKVSFKNPVAVPIGLYILILFVVSIVGNNSTESFRYFAKHTVNILMVFVAADCIKNKRQLSMLVKVFLISACFVSLLGVLQYFSRRWIFLKEPLSWIGIAPPAWHGRIISTRRHPLVFADNIALCLPLMAAYGAYSKKYLYAAALAVMAMALIFTYSRAPIASVAIVTAITLWINFKKLKVLFLIFFLSIGAAVMMAFLLKNIPLRYRIYSTGGRQHVWKAAQERVKEHPLFGVGILKTYEVYSDLDTSRVVKISHAHNTYLQVLVASGIFALITFFWIIYAFFKELLRRIKHPDVGKFEKYILVGLLLGFAAEGLCGMTDDLFCRAEIYYPIYFLMGLAMSRALDPSNSLKDGVKE